MLVSLQVVLLLIDGRVAWLPMRAETLKGHLDGLLLASLEAGPRHGYAIMEALRAGSGGQVDLPTGTVYPALRRLERAGLIRGTWSQAGGRQRRVYDLTPAGRRMLTAERGTWREFSAAVTALLEPAPRPVTP
jgi:PadR family transcriptional regulator PadR